MRTIDIKYLPIALIGLIAMVYVGLAPAPREGLELLWLVPLAFVVCVLLFSQIIDYHKGGVGLKILYSIIVVRYLISPVLIIATKGNVPFNWNQVSTEGYYFAIVISIVELFACCIAIRIFWNKYHTDIQKDIKIYTELDRYYTLTLGGLLIIGILAIVILARGLDGVQSSFGFLMLEEKYTSGYIDYYAVTTIQVLKSFLFVCIVAWAVRKYQYRNSIVWFLFACSVAFLNVAIYFGYNRSLIFETAVATVFTLLAAFPKRKQIITIALVPVTLVILYSIVTIKQFGISSKNVDIVDLTSVTELSNTIESYVNGMFPLASSFDAANEMQSRISPLTILKDATDNFFLFKVPGFFWANDWLSNIPSTIQLYQIYTYPMTGAMLPLAGQMWFYGGFILGPLLTIVSNVLVIYLLIRIEIVSKLQNNLQSIFLYSWLASLFGLIMCYCLITLWWSFSKFALFLFIVFWINNKFSLNKNSFYRELRV